PSPIVIALAWQSPSVLYAHCRTAQDAMTGISMMNFIANLRARVQHSPCRSRSRVKGAFCGPWPEERHADGLAAATVDGDVFDENVACPDLHLTEWRRSASRSSMRRRPFGRARRRSGCGETARLFSLDRTGRAPSWHGQQAWRKRAARWLPLSRVEHDD